MPSETWSSLQQMRKNCLYLDIAQEHPALVNYRGIRKDVNEGIQYFHRNRLVLLKDPKVHATANQQLHDAKDEVEKTISRYEFMKALKRRKWVVCPPVEESNKRSKSKRIEWKSCFSELEKAVDQDCVPKGCTRVQVEWNGCNVTAYRNEWSRDITGSAVETHLGMQTSHEYQFLRITPRHGEWDAYGNPSSEPDNSSAPESNNWIHSLCFGNQIYVIGWSVECSSSTPRKAHIRTIYSETNGILDEELRMKISAVPGSQFRSLIFFVLRKDFNFALS